MKSRAWKIVNLVLQPSQYVGRSGRSWSYLRKRASHHSCAPRSVLFTVDGCNTKFTIFHALDFNRGGLVTARHSELRYRVADLAGKAFTPSQVCDDPLIFAGRAVKRLKAKLARASDTIYWDEAPLTEATEYKGDLLIRDLWQNGMDSVHTMRVLNTDAKYHSAKTPEKCLQEAERGNKRMYLDACLQQHRHFSPSVASVDGLLGVEATATLKRLASPLATKWRQPYYKTCGYVKRRIVIALVRATHRCVRGSRVTAHRIIMQLPQWEDGAGLNLFR